MTIKASDPTSSPAPVFRRCLLVLICLLGFLSPAEVGGMPAPVARKGRAGPLAGAVDSRLDSSRITGPRSRNETHGRRAAGVRVVGQIGGRTEAVFVDGRYAYVGVGPRVLIFDVADPANPVVAGQTVPLDGIVHGIQVVGPHAYVVDGHLEIIDVSNPSRPRTVGSYQGAGVREVAVVGSYAYIIGGYDAGYLQILDVSNPARVRSVGRFDLEGGPEENYVESVAVAGRHAYVVTGLYERYDDYGRLDIIDVGDPTSPRQRGTHTFKGPAHSVAVAEEYAFIAADFAGLKIIDVSDPTAPAEAGTHPVRGGGLAVVAARRDDSSGQLLAYVADYMSGGLHIIDASDPAHPIQTAFYDDAVPATLAPLDMALVGNHAYIVEGGTSDYNPDPGGLRIIDISDPSHPVGVGVYKTPGHAEQVVVAEGYAYVGEGDTTYQEESSGGIRVIDASDPARLADAAYFDTGQAPLGLVLTGSVAYVAGWKQGLRLLDISDPAHLTEIGVSNVAPLTTDVAVAGSYAYVLNHHNNLSIVDVSDPTRPDTAGTYDVWFPSDVAVRGAFAYVTHYDGMDVVDVSNPTRPRRIGSIATGLAHPTVITLAGRYAYVLTEFGGLWIVDINDPAHPQKVGVFNTPWYTTDIAIGRLSSQPGRHYAYIATYVHGLRVIDVTDPTRPIEVGFYETPGLTWDVATAGEYLFVAGERAGLLVLQFAGPVAFPRLRLPLLLRGS